MNISEIANSFEKLIAEGKISFSPAKAEDLSPWAQFCVQGILEQWGLKWQLGSAEIDGAVCLKVDDPFLQYMDVFPQTQQFMWCTNGHADSVHPDEALVHCLRRAGVVAELGRGRSVILNDGEATVEDERLPGGGGAFSVRIRGRK